MIMTPEKFISDKAAQAAMALYGVEVEAASMEVQVTRKEFEGDYTLLVFPLAKVSHASPEMTGKAIGEWLVANTDYVEGFNVVKGFLNLCFSKAWWNEHFAAMASDGDYGQLPPTGKTVMVEFSSPNTNKPLHLGHVRNILLGWSVSELLAACGHRVVKVNLVNDRGIHICKSMIAWQRVGEGRTPQNSGQKGDHLVGDCYVAFNDLYKAEVKALVDADVKEEEAAKQAPIMREAQEMLLKWEQGDKETRELWETMNSWVYAGFDATYAALGVSFDRIYYESQTYLLGKALVQKGLDMGVFEREADGSVWCDLTADGLDRKLLLRSDGTSVYMTQDLGTAESRFEEYALDGLIYVVGNEQIYHFQVLKLILKKLGFDWSDSIHHLSYGMVELPDGKMKSREGTVVDADDLLEKMYVTAKETALALGKLEDMSEEEQDRLFKMIGLGALKYFIIKVDPKKTMLFDPQNSIDFNGNTGPFIQYTHARIQSILRKAAQAGVNYGPSDIHVDAEPSAKEIRLIKLMDSFPSKVAEAGTAFAPSIIANYTYELAKEFNQYYHDVPVLKEEDEGLKKYRLMLADMTARVLRKAMSILGIELPDRM